MCKGRFYTWSVKQVLGGVIGHLSDSISKSCELESNCAQEF